MMNFKQHVKRIANNEYVCCMSMFVTILLVYAIIFGALYAFVSPNYDTDYPEYEHCD